MASQSRPEDEAWRDVLCCPDTGTPLEALEPWLWSNEDGTSLFPEICHTPVLMPEIDDHLLKESLLVARAMAEFGGEEEVRRWFTGRYGRMNAPDPSVIDSEVLGEGFEGFWDALGLPAMMRRLIDVPPEALILNFMGDRQFNRVLDVGCGQGGMTQRMAKKAGMVLGLESNFYLAALANQILPKSEIQIGFHDPQSGWCRRPLPKDPVHNARVVCGSLHAPPFGPGVFDWVHCGHVLDLVGDPEAGLWRLIQTMTPDAWLTICSPWDFPDAGHFDALMALLDEWFVKKDGIAHHPWLRFHHKRRFILHDDWMWAGQLRPEALKHIG